MPSFGDSEKRRISGLSAAPLARDVELRGGPKASIRKACPEITVWLDTFSGQSGRTLLIGYARVSTDDQTLGLQRDAQRAEGCVRIFEDTVGGAGERPALRDAFDHLRARDYLVVWRLDRLGRSLKDLIERVESLRARGIGFRSLKEAIDTDSSAGQWSSTSSAPWPSSNGR